jgi:hypothetical protein
MTIDAFEEGHQLYTREPELMLAEVWWRIPKSYTITDAEAFVMGYIALRRQRDQRKREQQ